MTEAAKIVENLLNDQPVPEFDPKGMADEIAAEDAARQAALKASGEVSPETVVAGSHTYHRTEKKRDGTAASVKVTSVKTWKRDPDRWEIGWKYGLYQYGKINRHDAPEWTTIEPPPVQPAPRRR